MERFPIGWLQLGREHSVLNSKLGVEHRTLEDSPRRVDHQLHVQNQTRESSTLGHERFGCEGRSPKSYFLVQESGGMTGLLLVAMIT